MYISHAVYPFIYWWTLWLLPPLGYCKQCCYGHQYTNTSLRPWPQSFFTYTPKWYITQKLDYKEVCVSKNWCFWIVVLEKTLESPVDSKEVKPVNSKENPPWILIGRTDAEVQAQVPIFCPHDAKSQLVAAVHGITKSQTQFSDWTKTTIQK